MSYERVLRNAIVVLCLGLFLSLGGCSKNIIVHPMAETEFRSMPEGESYTPDRPGWFISDEVLMEVTGIDKVK